MTSYRGIVLAAGSGTRMFPLTKVSSKQLLPVYDKPMVYYPLSLLMLAGIRQIAIIVNKSELSSFRDLLGDGSQFGIELSYIEQSNPNGIAEAYLLAESFLNGSGSFLILGDNIFIGSRLGRSLSMIENGKGANIFLYEVDNPSEYGNAEIGKEGEILEITEKPKFPKSNFAIPGLYICDDTAADRVRELKPSSRGELEITDLLKSYLKQGQLRNTKLARGTAWIDAGTPETLFTASEYVRAIQSIQGIQIACLEEIAFNNGWIDASDLMKSESLHFKTRYGSYVRRLITND